MRENVHYDYLPCFTAAAAEGNQFRCGTKTHVQCMRRLVLPHRPKTLRLCHNVSMVFGYTQFVQVPLHKKQTNKNGSLAVLTFV